MCSKNIGYSLSDLLKRSPNIALVAERLSMKLENLQRKKLGIIASGEEALKDLAKDSANLHTLQLDNGDLETLVTHLRPSSCRGLSSTSTETVYLDALQDTKIAIQDFECAGFDDQSMFVSFSGSKGFHIHLNTSLLGLPIFKSSYDARDIIGDLVVGWTNVAVDQSTFNPLQVYRVTGSKHSASGLYKRTYTLSEFESLSLDALFDNAKNPGSWQLAR